MKVFVLFLGALIFISKSYSEVNPKTVKLYVTQYSVDEGLRQSMVKQIYSDSHGLIWIATGDGLHFFDGKAFKVFRINNVKAFPQVDNIMRNVFEFEPGRLLVSTSNSICKFDIKTGIFTLITQKQGLYPQLFCSLVKNKPFIWMYEKGYCIIDDTIVKPIKLNFKNDSVPPKDYIPLKIVPLAKNRYLIQGYKGIIELEGSSRIDDLTFTAHWVPFSVKCDDITSKLSSEVYVLSGTKIYSYSWNGVLKPIFDLGLSDNNSLFIDSNGAFWISSANRKSIYRLINNDLQKISLVALNRKAIGNIDPFTINFFEDKQKNIWITTDGDGTLLYQPRCYQFDKAEIGFTRCMYAKGDEVWVGTFRNGLWRLSRDFAMCQREYKELFDNGTDILDITFDKTNCLWAVTRNRIIVIGKDGNIIYSTPVSVSVARIIIHDPDTLLISTNNNLYTFKVNKQPVLVSKTFNFNFTGWACSGNKEWFGSTFGLFLIDKHDNHLAETFQRKQISSIQVKSLAKVGNQLWVASSAGVEIFDTTGKQLSLPPELEQLKDELIYSIIPDSLNRVWFSSNTGVGCISEDRTRIILFNTFNNLQSLEFNSNAFTSSSTGDIYFGGINGVNRINPKLVNLQGIIEEPQLISLYLSDSLYNKGISVGNDVVNLSWKEPNLSGKIFSTDYFNVEEQQYSFFLKNLDVRWNQPSKENTFNYRNLRSGEYTLMVKYCDAFGNWSSPKKILTIRIAPPYWERWWFVVALFLSIILITAFSVKKVQAIRFKNRIKELEHQNAIEKERLRISRDLHDELGAGLSLIMLNSSIALQKNKDNNLIDSYLEAINRNSKDLYENMNNLIWLLKNENQTLEALLSRLREVVSEIIEDSGIDYSIVLPENMESFVLTREVSRNIFLLIKEAINNAIKHSKGSKISLEVIKRSEYVIFNVWDNGVGFNQNDNASGNGLLNMKTRAKQLNADIVIDSKIGFGTFVSIKVNFVEVLS